MPRTWCAEIRRQIATSPKFQEMIRRQDQRRDEAMIAAGQQPPPDSMALRYPAGRLRTAGKPRTAA
jgi:hypothetical protein